jgi:hypothetical protein
MRSTTFSPIGHHWNGTHTRFDGTRLWYCRDCDLGLIWRRFVELWQWRRWVHNRDFNRRAGLSWFTGWRLLMREIRFYRAHTHYRRGREQ